MKTHTQASANSFGIRTIKETDTLDVNNNPQAVVMVEGSASENHLGETGGRLVSVSKEFIRPADTTAYAAGDIISDGALPQELPNAARINGGTGYLTGALIVTDKKSIMPRIRVHLFNQLGATVAADNAAHKSVYADLEKRAGHFDFPALATSADTANSDTSDASDYTIRIPFVCAQTSRNLYFVLETLDAFTPAPGQKFTLTILVDLN